MHGDKAIRRHRHAAVCVGARVTLMRPVTKYLLLQGPGWLLAGVVLFVLWRWTKISGQLGASLFFLWVGKDIAVYPFVRNAYRSDVPTGAKRMVGRTGVVQQPLVPRGYVRVQGELWRAEGPPGNPPLPAGAAVRITGARRMTLVVEARPADEG